ncbi:hypothetical protein SH1V18_20620 [Vallitalea longa]|uniref:DUF2520 domain-containing protein n=1 Tax=Vallitalea longa TaxID=2936439 RepID=A0A9W6DFL1_9FIRM|nr:Rossmann-like and DUF2520 domain-containing protein [Vallitalea longa]GKX29582.1 hypothetical protein SH1V18_20620 [Vallitalea longa]
MFGFIGAGKVGTTLGIYLNNCNLPITGYTSKSYSSAKKSAELTDSTAYEVIETLVDSSKYIMITTPDDNIKDIVSKLLLIDTNWNDKTICHTSGTYASTILEPLHKLGSTTVSLHPMLSFADIDNAVKMLPHTPLTLEGQGIHLQDFIDTLKLSNLNITTIKPEQKTLYHTAACTVSNYLVTLINTGIELLKTIGFEQETALELIHPLVKGTVDNIFTKGPTEALTGPIARGDVNTIKTHLRALTNQDNRLKEFYCLLGNETVDLAKKQKKLNEYTLNNIKEVLHYEINNNPNNKEKEVKK